MVNSYLLVSNKSEGINNRSSIKGQVRNLLRHYLLEYVLRNTHRVQ